MIEHEPRGVPGQRDAGLHSRFQGTDGRRRVAALVRDLDAAQDRWWSQGDLPALMLLRDGLLALEAGYPLGEGQRTLLLRAALAHGRGMITALAHQTDPERTADVLADALLDPRPRRLGGSLPVELVRRLRQEDANGAAWGAHLRQLLGMETTLPLEPRRSHAAQLLAQLQHGRPTPPPSSNLVRSWGRTNPLPPGMDSAVGLAPLPGTYVGTYLDTFVDFRPMRRPSRFWAGLFLFLAMLLLGTASVLAWQGNAARSDADTIVVPAGTYPISDPAQPGQERLVQVQAFRLDRTEVTNADYRRCREAGVCPLPAGSSLGQVQAETLSIMDPTKQAYPVVGVNWGAANAYCAWEGKRLPLEEEWEIVAAVAPNSMRRLTYPWGDQFRPFVVNGADSNGNGEMGPRPVGSFAPGGNSAFGAVDMAGNVAEWTATLLESGIFVVKGGSYQDGSLGLRSDSWQAIPAETAAPWLGFRCAMTGSGQ